MHAPQFSHTESATILHNLIQAKVLRYRKGIYESTHQMGWGSQFYWRNRK